MATQINSIIPNSVIVKTGYNNEQRLGMQEAIIGEWFKLIHKVYQIDLSG